MKTKDFIACISAIFILNLSYGWTGLDPLAEKAPGVSPYAYCMNNPVRYVDPDGRDVWEINNRGEITDRIKDKTQDAFHMVQRIDDKWQRVEGQSISFEYGTVTAVRTPVVKMSDGNGGSVPIKLTMFEVAGDKYATRLFEFMGSGQTTNVEWSHIQVGTSNSGRNIVGTTEGGDNFSAVNDYVLRSGYTVKKDNHSHVYNSNVSDADKEQAGRLNHLFPNAIMSNYYRGVCTQYNKHGPIIPTATIIAPVNINHR